MLRCIFTRTKNKHQLLSANKNLLTKFCDDIAVMFHDKQILYLIVTNTYLTLTNSLSESAFLNDKKFVLLIKFPSHIVLLIR